MHEDYRVGPLSGSTFELAFILLIRLDDISAIASEDEDVDGALREVLSETGDRRVLAFVEVVLHLQVREDPRADNEYGKHEQPDQAVLHRAPSARMTAFAGD